PAPTLPYPLSLHDALPISFLIVRNVLVNTHFHASMRHKLEPALEVRGFEPLSCFFAVHGLFWLLPRRRWGLPARDVLHTDHGSQHEPGDTRFAKNLPDQR